MVADFDVIDFLHVLTSRSAELRVIIEQAKGKLAERLGIDTNQAFTILRDQARNRNQRLSDLARAFVEGTQAVTRPATSSARQRYPAASHPRPGPPPPAH
jgi:hypothetical protein